MGMDRADVIARTIEEQVAASPKVAQEYLEQMHKLIHADESPQPQKH